jgi:site-specific recombinase XerD
MTHAQTAGRITSLSRLETETAVSISAPEVDAATAAAWSTAAAAWLDNLQSERTRRAYLVAWRAFLAHAGKHPSAVERADLVDYRNHMKSGGYEPATTSLHLSAISSFYRHAAEAGLVDANPARGVKWPRVEPYATVKAAVAQLDDGDGDIRLLATTAGGDLVDVRDRAIILLLMVHGLRVGEAATLRRGDLNGRFLDILRKGKESRETIELAPVVETAVSTYLAMRGAVDAGAPLFMATPEGQAATNRLPGRQYEEGPLTARAIRAMLARRCRRVFGKGHKVTPHTLRHLAATRAEQSGAVLTDVAALLGHKSTRITHTYLTKTSRRGDALARKLSARYEDLA